MSGGRLETHRDTDHLATGTHRGSNGTTLVDLTAQFDVFVGQTGLAINNVTSGEWSHIATINAIEITTDDALNWNAGDTYKIYKTTTYNSLISKEWTDSSKGWKADKRELVNGWFAEDWDINRDSSGGTRKMFGPGQPDRN